MGKTNILNTMSEKLLYLLAKYKLLCKLHFFLYNSKFVVCNNEIYDLNDEQWSDIFSRKYGQKWTELSVKIITDLKSIKAFITRKRFTKRQALY